MIQLPPMLAKKKRRDNRVRCPAHLKWVAKHLCVVPGCDERDPEKIVAHHVRNGTDGGMGMKPGDQWVVSLSHKHHVELHNIGQDTFEKRYDIDLLALAEEFWRKDHRARQAWKAKNRGNS